MSNWSPAKIITGSADSATTTHPFKIYMQVKETNRVKQYSVAVSYHSQLFVGFNSNSNYMSFKKQTITGLDFYQPIPDPTNKNVYVTLDCKVSNGAITSADINFLPEGSKGLAPFSFNDSKNSDQSDAQVIIGVIVNDAEAKPGTPGGGNAQSTYVIQKVFTDLIVTNMVINNSPVIMPVPRWGGPIN